MRILRVFPCRTSYTPTDSLAWIGSPFQQMEFDNSGKIKEIPFHDEVHISCVFTWDKDYCGELAELWHRATNKPVRLGGPAFGSPAKDFTPGLYMKSNIVFTSRGCNNSCPWCGVPKLEGKLAELPICAGHVIQDNNFLQTNRTHQRKVFEMLKTQKGICFKGGLETDLITAGIADDFAGVWIAELWLACDTDGALPRLKKATEILKRRGFNRSKIKCYALIGDDMDKNEARLQEIYHAGAMPFAQLYQPTNQDTKKEYSSDWKKFARMWQRPAATEAHMKKGTSYKDFST